MSNCGSYNRGLRKDIKPIDDSANMEIEERNNLLETLIGEPVTNYDKQSKEYLNNVDKKLNKIGLTIWDVDGNCKRFYVITDEISEKWNDLCTIDDDLYAEESINYVEEDADNFDEDGEFIEEIESQCLSCFRKCKNGMCDLKKVHISENEDNNCWGYLPCNFGGDNFEDSNY